MQTEKNILYYVFKNFYTSVLARFFIVASSIITLPLIIKGLGGLSAYGVWTSVCAFFAILELLDCVIVVGMSRLVARANAKKIKIGSLIKTLIITEAFVSVLILLVTFFSAKFLVYKLQIDYKTSEIIYYSVLLRGIILAVSMPFRVGTPILLGLRKFGINFIAEALVSIIYLISVTFLYFTNNISYLSIAFLVSFSAFMNSFITFFYAHKYSRPWNLITSRYNAKFIILTFNQSWTSLSLFFSQTLSINLITLFLGLYVRKEDSALWTLLIFVGNQVSYFSSGLASPFTTLSTEYAALKKTKDLITSVALAAHASFELILIALIGFVIFGNMLIEIIFPSILKDGFSSKFTILIEALLISYLFISPCNVLRNFLLGTKLHNKVAYTNLISFLASLIVLFFILPGYGLYGALASRIFFLTSSSLYVCLLFYNFLPDVKRTFYIKNTLLKIFGYSAIGFGCMIINSKFSLSAFWTVMLIITYCSLCFVNLILTWFKNAEITT
jgi:O-antigen/teichoic acid export membrane protein